MRPAVFATVLIIISTTLFANPPERVISLSPATTEIIYELKKLDTVVGVTTYCDYPESAKTINKVGGYFEKTINIEEIILLEPDIVFCEEAAHSGLKSIFDQLQINYVYVKAQDYSDIFNNIEIIGKVLGVEEEAEILAERLHGIEKDLSEKIPPVENRPRIFWEIWDEPLMTAGRDSFIGRCIEIAGGVNIFSDSSGQWPQVNSEAVLVRNPDIIIIASTDNGSLTYRDIADRPGWRHLSAVEKGNIHFVSESLFSRPTPRIIEGTAELYKLFYGDT